MSLTVADKLLLAAYKLEESQRRPFSAEDLVVSAWELFPDTFGLSGYQGAKGARSYPDSNRVFAEIMGSKPIRSRGLLTKVGSKMYQLTPSGREMGRHLSDRGTSTGHDKSLLGRETKDEIRRLLASKAAEKIREHRSDDLTFFDACTFWGISARSSAIELAGKLSGLESIIEASKESLNGKTVNLEHGRDPFGARDIDLLKKVHRVLQTRFKAELAIIRKRTDQRT